MNGLDIAILAIVGISMIYGIYRGFLHTVLSVACFLVSVVLAFLFAPRLAALIQTQTGITSTLSTYTDAVARVGDVELAQTPVSYLSTEGIRQVLQSVGLPDFLSRVLENNLLTRSLAGEGAVTVNDYVKDTLVSAALNVGCYVAVFFVSSLILGLIASLIRHVFKFPPLKLMDRTVGAVFGLVRGGIIVYVLFLLLPVVATVIPSDVVESYVSGSTLAPVFQSGGFFTRVIGIK